MRAAKAITLTLLLIALIWALNKPWGKVPALGQLLHPQTGWMQNDAEDALVLSTSDLPHLKDEVQVWVDERWVPHIRSNNFYDLYYLQGYIHAYHRLWQMDMQTRAAAGRVSEVVGSRALKFDRDQRRKGMVYGAEKSLLSMTSDPATKEVLVAYTQGVNDRIAQLTDAQFPIEYKLMGFEPEPWTNLKTALLLKYMADDLTGKVDDFGNSWLKQNLPDSLFQLLYPDRIVGESPVIPAGTNYAAPSLPIPVALGDTAFVTMPTDTTLHDLYEEHAIKGSNNWAVKGSRTKTGAPILCNDPHLTLNLPSLWFEIQLQCKDMNVYGVSLPGAPGVIIGFNDSLAWGLTNNARDVKDYYRIKQLNSKQYEWEGAAKDFAVRYPEIKIKDSCSFIDTVLFTVHGPVQYDHSFPDPANSHALYALKWMGHEPSNEIKTIVGLNRARNIKEAQSAIHYFFCPAQNFVYADRAGNIAMFTQGQFVNKWKDQGKYVMDGKYAATLWGKYIPMNENPAIINPASEYVSSANQVTTDDRYPYWYNGGFVHFRAWEINQRLDSMKGSTIADHQQMQQDYHSLLMEKVFAYMYRHSNRMADTTLLQGETYALTPESKSASLFQWWWKEFHYAVWHDEFKNVPNALWPSAERTMQLLMERADLSFYDDVSTPQKETLYDVLSSSYQKATDSIQEHSKKLSEAWYQIKNVRVNHLAKLPAFSVSGIKAGGWNHTINAIKETHGPSWRMVVQLNKDSIEAYGVYPGGQSGNPASSHYKNMIEPWAEGKYYRLLFLPNQPNQNHPSIKETFVLKPSDQ